MILRRVITHFRKQEWTAIGLDFLIVVVGVFVGLQVSNWNATRMEAHQGAKFAERLKADMRIEAWNYDVLVDYLEDVRDNVDLALAVLEGSPAASDEQLLIYAYRATQFAGGVRRRATYDELTSTGSIGLIKDPALRDAAVMFYTFPAIDQAGDEGISSAYRIVFRQSLPVDVQIALEEACGDRFTPIGDYGIIGNQLNYSCSTSLTPDQIKEAASALRAVPEIIPMLRLRAMDVRTQLANLTFTNRDIREILNAVVEVSPG